MSAIDLVEATAHVKNGRLFITNRRSFDQQLRERLKESWVLEVLVRRRRATRSMQQNNFYWGVCIQLISEHTGYTPEEVHDLAKQMFIPKHLALADGNGEVRGEFVIGGSTRELDTKGFTEYLERLRQWAAEELDLFIPDPESV